MSRTQARFWDSFAEAFDLGESFPNRNLFAEGEALNPIDLTVAPGDNAWVPIDLTVATPRYVAGSAPKNKRKGTRPQRLTLQQREQLSWCYGK